jgi:hypothetical protein
MSERMPPERPRKPGEGELGPISDEDLVTLRGDPWGLDPRTGLPPQMPGLDPRAVAARDDNINTSDDW